MYPSYIQYVKLYTKCVIYTGNSVLFESIKQKIAYQQWTNDTKT